MLLWNQKGAIKMKKYKITLLVSVVAAIIIEALPFGAVCNFATPEKTITQTFSYFSLIPYGYANFGPFLTAVSTCILFIFAIILFTPKAKKIITAAAVISGFSLFTSVLPLFQSCFGVHFTLDAAAICCYNDYKIKKRGNSE